MELRVVAIHLPLDSTVEARVRAQALRAFERFGQSVRSVELRLSDINGPRGGLDKRASIEVTFLDGLPDVHVSQTAAEIGEAVDLAVDRARRAMVRRLDRSRTIRHRSIRDTAWAQAWSSP